jgi:hypothetical protein
MLEAYATLASGARMMVVLPSTNLRIIGEASSNRMAIDEFGEETGVQTNFLCGNISKATRYIL